MKVYLDPQPVHGRAIWRVARALKDYAPPWVTVVQDVAQADLHIVHALGDGERKPILDHLEAGTQIPYALIQYCVRTTETPDTKDWLQVWRQSALTWSYYDLPRLLVQDGQPNLLPHFYHAPLGVDPVFLKSSWPPGRKFIVGTSGHVAATEGIPEWVTVVSRQNERGFHLGPMLAEHDTRWTCLNGLTDHHLATYWASCRYVAAMRRVEGFEFPGIEGLVCGARPICFDRPHYRWWYEDSASYVPEGTHDDVVEALQQIVNGPYRPVTASEIQWARQRFSWPTIITGFWDRIAG